MRLELGRKLRGSYSMTPVKDVSTLMENSHAYVWRHPLFGIEVYFDKYTSLGESVAGSCECTEDAKEKELDINARLLVAAFSKASAYAIESFILEQQHSSFDAGVRHAQVKMRAALGFDLEET